MHERERGQSVACTLAPWDRDVTRMHRRSQVSHTPTVTRRPTGQGFEVGAPFGASWFTGAGGRDDIRVRSTLLTRVVKRRTADGRPGPCGQTSGARAGPPAAGR